MLQAGLNKKGPAVFRGKKSISRPDIYRESKPYFNYTRLEMYIVPK